MTVHLVQGFRAVACVAVLVSSFSATVFVSPARAQLVLGTCVFFDGPYLMGERLVIAVDVDLDPDLTNDVALLSDMDDRAESYRCDRGCRAVAYDQPDFQGQRWELPIFMPLLYDAANRISSVQVICDGTMG